MKLPSVLALLALSTTLPAVDWPQWRGPNRDGVVTDPSTSADALPAEPKVLWKIDTGDGHASPVVEGNRLVFLDAENGQETAHCVDLATGKQIWKQPIAPLVDFSNFGTGPRCTPLIEARPRVRPILQRRVSLPESGRRQDAVAHQLRDRLRRQIAR